MIIFLLLLKLSKDVHYLDEKVKIIEGAQSKEDILFMAFWNSKS